MKCSITSSPPHVAAQEGAVRLTHLLRADPYGPPQRPRHAHVAVANVLYQPHSIAARIGLDVDAYLGRVSEWAR